MVAELTVYLRGWVGYFGYCQTPSILERLDSYTRRRLRAVAWHQWRRGRRRYAQLRRRGVDHHTAAKTAGSCHGPWRLSRSPAIHIALPNRLWDSLGLIRLTAVGRT